MPETWTEARHGVQVVEAILKLILAALVEGWFRDVDVAARVEVRIALGINATLWANAHILLHILRIARVLVGVVLDEHVVGLARHAERLIVTV